MDEDSSIYMLHKIPQSSNITGKAYLSSKNSLATKDWRTTLNLLSSNCSSIIDNSDDIKIKVIYNDTDQNILEISNLLSKSNCDEISTKCLNLNKEKISYGATRDNKRIIVFDKLLADLIWRKVHPLLKQIYDENKFKIVPLGFDVIRGTWELSGVNEAFRFNSYESKLNEKFTVHRDAQFCPSGDLRSLFSLVIYLNDDFVDGETKFYVPKQENIETKEMSIKDEITANCGLQDGYNHVSIKPVLGNAILFTQNILHEGLQLLNSSKRILKTDIMVSRKEKFGFQVSNVEAEDYLKCLDYFRKAQQLELAGDDNTLVNELYEKCLSIRYSYPTKSMLRMDLHGNYTSERTDLSQNKICDNSDNCVDDLNIFIPVISKSKEINPFTLFPVEIWENIFLNIENDRTSKSLAAAFPALSCIKRKFDLNYFVPKLVETRGIVYKFSFKNSSFVCENIEACCRVLAGYSIYLLAHNDKDKMYTVRYNQENNEVTAIPLNDFLSSLYYNEQSYGCIYKVTQHDDEKNPENDFNESVDRNYMLLKHKKDFSGVDITSEFSCKIKFEFTDDKQIDDSIENSDVINIMDRLYTSNYISRYFWRQFEDDGEQGYGQYLQNIVEKGVPGAAIVRSLTNSCTFGDYEYCYCLITEENEALTTACKSQVFNHLVFDFEKHSLKVTKLSKENHSYDSFYAMKLFKEVALEATFFEHGYKVNISSLTENSFNHAGCQCGGPSFELQEYNKLQSYPYLDNINMVFEMIEGEMFATTCYGGITAM